VPRTLAVDWSGRRQGAAAHIWVAEAEPDGELTRLECGRGRDELATFVLELADADPDLVVGLDLSPSFPHWFVESLGCPDGPSLWEVAEREGEGWLAACEPPFWGRPGRCRPPDDDARPAFRDTEMALPRRPKSVFQIGGAGAVGTGSIRGMPILRRLRAAGFAVWPFDPPRPPMVVEAWPRLFALDTNRSDPAAIAPFPSADAFDAAVTARAMAAHAERFTSLAPPPFPHAATEGAVWVP
jgi:hypothetical protein